MRRAGNLKLAGTPGAKGDSLGQGQSSKLGPEKQWSGQMETEPKLACVAKSCISSCPRDCKSGQGPWTGGTWFLLLREVKGPCRAGGH